MSGGGSVAGGCPMITPLGVPGTGVEEPPGYITGVMGVITGGGTVSISVGGGGSVGGGELGGIQVGGGSVVGGAFTLV